MTAVNTTIRGDDVISTLNYVNASDVFFQFPYAALGLIEPYPDKMEKVYNQLKGVRGWRSIQNINIDMTV